jgi:hypothetical protein
VVERLAADVDRAKHPKNWTKLKLEWSRMSFSSEDMPHLVFMEVASGCQNRPDATQVIALFLSKNTIFMGKKNVNK